MDATTMQRQSSRTFDGDEGNYVVPPANILARENEYVLELEMPGVRKEDLEITLEGTDMTIIGRRKVELPEGELCYCESTLADYRRSFEIGPDVDTGRISAEMDQGVVRLRLPKSEKAKPRKIQITG